MGPWLLIHAAAHILYHPLLCGVAGHNDNMRVMLLIRIIVLDPPRLNVNYLREWWEGNNEGHVEESQLSQSGATFGRDFPGSHKAIVKIKISWPFLPVEAKWKWLNHLSTGFTGGLAGPITHADYWCLHLENMDHSLTSRTSTGLFF